MFEEAVCRDAGSGMRIDRQSGMEIRYSLSRPENQLERQDFPPKTDQMNGGGAAGFPDLIVGRHVLELDSVGQRGDPGQEIPILFYPCSGERVVQETVGDHDTGMEQVLAFGFQCLDRSDGLVNFQDLLDRFFQVFPKIGGGQNEKRRHRDHQDTTRHPHQKPDQFASEILHSPILSVFEIPCPGIPFFCNREVD
jgi:hypothetical protein